MLAHKKHNLLSEHNSASNDLLLAVDRMEDFRFVHHVFKIRNLVP